MDQGNKHDPTRPSDQCGGTQRGESSKRARGDGGETVDHNTGRDDGLGRPAGPCMLHGQGAEHRTQAKASEQDSINNGAVFHCFRDERQQGGEARGKE